MSQASEQHYYQLFEHMPICIFVADLTVMPVVILEVNRRAVLTYGYTAAQLIGNPAALLVPEESRASIQAVIQRVQVGETVTTETTNLHRDGTTFPVRINASLDPTDSGHMIITVEDITPERQRRTEAEAIDADRLRIAHELHDGVAQSLAGLRFKSAQWFHLADSAPPAMRDALSELQSVLYSAIDDIRRAIFALRPVDLETLGFFPALKQLVTDFGIQNQLAPRLNVSGTPETMPAIHELPLFRIIQEGLNNVSQHARASSVLVNLTVDAGSVALSLRDNGRGFDPNLLGTVDHSPHFGLRQMRERIVELGGTLDIHSANGLGTELIVTLPLATGESRDAAD